MPQIFRPGATFIFRAAVVAAGLVLMAGAAVALWVPRSDRATGVGYAPRQPVPFSHAIHSGGLGIDCRYCHTGVERTAHAGMPTAETCMTCHSQVWVDTPQLAPVAESHAGGGPLPWARVHRLPDHSHFHHGIHTAAGVACESCHGRVDRMPVVAQVNSLRMTWCLDCHRDPAASLRPPEAVFAAEWDGPPDDRAAAALAARNPHDDRSAGLLTSCSTCHR